MLLGVAEPADSVLAPAIGTAARVIMGKVVPGVAIGAVVLAHRAPLALAHIGAPFAPGLPALVRLGKALLFRGDRRGHRSVLPVASARSVRAHRRGRAEQANDLLGDLAGGRADVDNQRIFVRSGFLQRIDLALQQARRHEVAAAPRQMLGHDIAAAAKIDQPYFRPVADDDPAIRPLERGAGDDARLLAGALSRRSRRPRSRARAGGPHRSAGFRHASWRRWPRDAARRPPRKASRGAPRAPRRWSTCRRPTRP